MWSYPQSLCALRRTCKAVVIVELSTSANGGCFERTQANARSLFD
jgi:hypothetical protein